MLLLSSLTSCSKDEVVQLPTDECVLNPNIEKCNPPINNGCLNSEVISSYIWLLPIDGSGAEKVEIRHTLALRNMAWNGVISDLNQQLCEYDTELSVNVLVDGLSYDADEIGFAGQLRVEHYVIAMYHPRKGFNDHFIIYNLNNREWERWIEGGKSNLSEPTIHSRGTLN